MRIAILGSGPAALFAAHAAIGLGNEVRIFSALGSKNDVFGAQYMEAPVPGLSGEPFILSKLNEGDHEIWLEKIGDLPYQNSGGEQEAWDLRDAYARAWAEYGHMVEPWIHTDRTLSKLVAKSDLVISSIPAWDLCEDGFHFFQSETVYVTDYVKALGRFEDPAVDNLVVCSGFEDDWWFRSSRVLGYETTEFPAGHHPEGLRPVVVPIRSDCTCHPSIVRVGVNGAWNTAYPPERAFEQATQAIAREAL